MCFRTLTALSRPLALLRGFGISPSLKVFGISRLIHTSRQPGLQTKLLKWTQSQNPLFRKQLWNPWINSLLKSGMSSSFLPGSSNSLRLFMNRIFNRTPASQTEPESVTKQEETKKEPILVQIVSPPFWRRLAELMIPNLIIIIMLLGMLILFSRDDKKGNFPFTISNAHHEVANVEVKFEDVKGLEEVKDELKEVIEYLKNPQKFKKLGARLPKGVLLVGPPGTGKTLLARAIAGEAGVRFLYCSGSSFDELFVGVGPKRIRNLFEDAKRSPNGCIIFIDEIDTLGISRQHSLNTNSARESTLNQLLTELDGFKQTEGIIVIGATNFPESLDSALTRPGRFDKIININLPDVLGRKEILEYYLSKVKHDTDVNSSVLARGTPGFSGADLSNLVNLAAIKASVNNQDLVHMKNLEEAKDDVIMGIKKKGAFKDPEELKLTAYHEGGHALVAFHIDKSDPLHKATIIPRGFSLGMTVQLPEKDEQTKSKKKMMSSLAILYGGRVAEEIIFGADEITTGASSDLQKATTLATAMVTKFGLYPEVGQVFYKDVEKLSEDEKQLIDRTVKKILQNSYETAKSILLKHKDELHLLAKALLEYETLTGEEIKLVIQGEKLSK